MDHIQPQRILYTITTLAEYNNGKRATIKGEDRWRGTTVPIIHESVTSMILLGYHVDVYIIAAFPILPHRLQLLRDVLPTTVGMQVWDDAMPLNYDMKFYKNKKDHKDIPTDMKILTNHTRGLARQHRFVLKDKLPYYDMFVQFEDDMLVKGHHVHHFVQMAHQLYQLRTTAPLDNYTTSTTSTTTGNHRKTFGEQYFDMCNDKESMMHSGAFVQPLAIDALRHAVPGFVRVEVMLDNTTLHWQPQAPRLPVAYPMVGTKKQHVDPSICCHVSPQRAHAKLPQAPTYRQPILWETQILPLGIRPLSHHHDDWVVLLRGTAQCWPDYWIYRAYPHLAHQHNVTFRPAPAERKYTNNQGGWMATRLQLLEWNNNYMHDQHSTTATTTTICDGGLLPPFDPPFYAMDGLDLRDVEYWSGGIQLSTYRNGCRLQRVVSIQTPNRFSSHILYHTANNKQEQLQHVQERFTRLDDLYGMLYALKLRAEHEVDLLHGDEAAQHEEAAHHDEIEEEEA